MKCPNCDLELDEKYFRKIKVYNCPKCGFMHGHHKDHSKVVDQMYAYVITDDDGYESIPGADISGIIMPLTTSQKSIAKKMESGAKELKEKGYFIKLVTFKKIKEEHL